MKRTLCLSVLLLLLGSVTLLAGETPRVNIEDPVLLVYQEPGDQRMRIIATPPAGFTVDSYALVIVGVVKFLAGSYNVSNEEAWAAIDRARRHDARGGKPPPR